MKKYVLICIITFLFAFLFGSCTGVRVYDSETRKRAMARLDKEMDLNNWDKALEIIDALLEYSPGDCSLYKKRLSIYSGLNKKEILYREIIKNYMNCKGDDEYLENALVFLQNYDDAESEYRVAKILYELTGDEQHEKYLRNALERYCIALYKKAETYKNNGEIQKAHAILDSILNIDPSFVFAHRFKANLYFEQNDYENSLNSIKKLLHFEENNEKDLELYAELLFIKEDYRESLGIYEKLLRLYPHNPYARERFQKLRIQAGKEDILEDLVLNIRHNQYARLDELAVLLYYNLYNMLADLDMQYMIIIDIDDNQYKDYIEFLVFRGIININQKRQFEPSKPVTRGVLAAILYNITSLFMDTGRAEANPPADRYRDITLNHNYFDIVKVMDYYKLIEPKNSYEYDVTQVMSVDNINQSIQRLKKLITDKEN